MSSEKFVQIHEGYRVPEEDYKAHMTRMTQEVEAEQRPDMLTCTEEDAWKAAETIRESINNLG